MLNRLIEFTLRRRMLVVGVFLIFLIVGVIALHLLNIEAYPDPSPPIVEVITQNPGQSAEEVERYITIPIEIGLAGTPGLVHVRSISLYGLSDVRVDFTYKTDYYFALQQVINRLNTVTLPSGIQPQISPESPIGEIYRYQLVGPPGYSLIDLKTLQDWVLERSFRTIPGVIDVVGWGGLTKEYHVDVDLQKLVAYKIPLNQVLTAISNSNQNVGARTLDIGEQSADVRGIGLIRSIDDINNIVLAQSNGIPVLLKDVARSEISHTPRLGIAGRDHDPDVVEGIVLMRHGEKSMPVIQRVAKAVDEMNHSGILPAGVRIVSFYDRRDLIHVTTHTVLHNILFGILLVFLIQYFFLGDLRSAVVVSASIPFALFFAICLMVLFGESANLLSIGAIDLGIIVDATVIMVENIFRRLREDHASPHAPGVEGLEGHKLLNIYRSATDISREIFFSGAITVAAFLPLFTMQGVEGQIFAPMARTYAYALIGALLATFMIAPALSAILFPDHMEEVETWLFRHLRTGFDRALQTVLKYRNKTIGVVVILFLSAVLLGPRLGSEFLPKLEEGNLWVRATMPSTISLEAGESSVAHMRDLFMSFPEVVTVVSQHGRPDDGTDATGFFNVEFFVPLKPASQWPHGMTKVKLIDQMKKKLDEEFVGVDFNFSQNIEDNVEEALSGVKGENSVKLFGPDLDVLERKAGEIQKQLESVPGIQDVGVFTELGQPNVLIEVDRQRCARYGLAAGDVNAIVQAAIGGQAVTNIYEGEKTFSLVVRLMPQYRESVEAIKNIYVPTPSGAQVPLQDVCTIQLRSGASYVYREQNERYIPIKFSVRGRDLGSAVAEGQAKVARSVQLPEGYHADWTGEFGELKDAEARLAVIVPLSLIVIVLLLYGTFGTFRDTALVLLSIPFAVMGGIFALFITRIHFSISAAVGFISLFGVSVMNGIILISYYRELRHGGMSREQALLQAPKVRMRPVVMTCLSACLGLFPAAVSTGIGSETQRPLATVVVGGMLLAPILILLFMPALLSIIPERIGSWE